QRVVLLTVGPSPARFPARSEPGSAVMCRTLHRLVCSGLSGPSSSGVALFRRGFGSIDGRPVPTRLWAQLRQFGAHAPNTASVCLFGAFSPLFVWAGLFRRG